MWKVKIKKIGESYCFANGWSKVAKDAQMGLADFLIFELVNESTFKMKIYTPNGCEKFLTSRNHVEHKSDDHMAMILFLCRLSLNHTKRFW